MELESLFRAVKTRRASRIIAPRGTATDVNRTPLVWLGFMSIWLAVMMSPSESCSSALFDWLAT